MGRNRVTRWVAPVAFLVAVTIGALVVHAGLEHGRHHANRPATTTTAKKKTHHAHRRSQQHRQTYTVQANDTFESIAAKEGTTVARLEQLNPGVDPTALHVGDKIRVK